MYFLHLLYFGLWGLASLYYAPLGLEDPGFRKIVYWHSLYDNRDAFGPLMAIGVAYSLYYYAATKNKLAILASVLCVLGVLTSFGRGVFLSVIVACVLIFYHAKNKSKVVLIVLGLGVMGTAIAPGVAGRYAESMGTIFSEGTHKGTGADRKILWTWAARVFMLNPIAGVGPSNFGIAVFKVVPLSEAAQHGYTKGSLWGRALHSTPMTVLSEYGTLGILAMIFLIYDFFRSNNAVRRANTAAEAAGADLVHGFSPAFVENIALALQTAFLTMCINSIFYEIFYVAMLGHLITLNRLFYFATNTHRTSAVFVAAPVRSLRRLGAKIMAKPASAALTPGDGAMGATSASPRPVMRGLYR